MKKFIWGMPIVIMVLMMSVICSCGNKSKAIAESSVEESMETDPAAAKEFLQGMYKDYYESYNKEMSEEVFLAKYFTKEAIQKFYVEEEYTAGEYYYDTYFLLTGVIGGKGDYGDEVISRTIVPESNDWFLVTNVWDYGSKCKIHLQVKSVDGEYKIVDLKEESSEEQNVEETPDVSKGFYVEVNHGYYFYTPRFLREGEQQRELTKDNNVFYESKGYSLNISVDESDIESQFWMYNTMRSRAGDEPYEESMKTKEEDYLKVDDNSGSILLIMQSKGSKMCGTMYFTYPEGGKAIVDEAIEKSIQKTRENDI